MFPDAVICPVNKCVSEIAFPKIEFPVVLIFPIIAIPEDKIFRVWVFPALKLISLGPSWKIKVSESLINLNPLLSSPETSILLAEIAPEEVILTCYSICV